MVESRRRKRKIRWSRLYTFSCGGGGSHRRGGGGDDDDVTTGGEQIGQKGFSRVVHCNDPDGAEAVRLRYRGNYVSTTKYTAVNFLPKSLFEQFRRVANVYFLVVAFVSFSPLAPYSAFSVLLPLGMVIGATMIKEGIEDWRRRSQDIDANNRKVMVYRDSKFHETRWKTLRVGDIVKVSKDEYFPSDLFLISSSYDDGICYVETMNLDGETNLKVKHSLEITSHLREEESLSEFRAVIKCEDPNVNLYNFVGNLDYGDKTYSLSLQQILLRDSKLKNTEFIYGAVIFTGHDTKVMQNSTEPPSKRSKVEKRMDKIIYVLFVSLVLVSFIGSVLFGVETRRDIHGGENNLLQRWYLRPDETPALYDPRRPFLASFLHFLTALMLYGYLIPISLYVSIEVVKVLQSLFINHDRDMYDDETDKPARARTSNLNEELGQVHTILSDKTGTLTCNSMDFVKCSIAGTCYGRGMTEVEIALDKKSGRDDDNNNNNNNNNNDNNVGHNETLRSIKGFNFSDERIADGNWVKEAYSDVIQKFFRVLAICHTAIADGDNKESGEISYEAESPDEAAFVIAAGELGFQFYERTQSAVHLYETDFSTGKKVERVYELLHMLEFSSSRKRMSVIVRNMENQLLLLCKGADSVMFEKLADNGRQFEAETRTHIKKYAEAGLRTLVIAYRELDEEEFKRWEEEFLKAKTSVSQERDALMSAAADKIERDLILLGATAVEDKLQKGVPECIDKLSQAGIKLWVLTGDKMETAINIGYACSLLRQDMNRISITLDSPDIIALEKGGDKEAARKASLESTIRQIRDATFEIQNAKAMSYDLDKEISVSFGLIIDGKSLEYSLLDEVKMSFFYLAASCSSVICCRSTPKQKALVTRLVKEGTGKTTLAVGDGANDVGMLQEADLGVGISGVEGMQAVMASDFAIAQFRFLERLLLVHGHWCYRRISMMICYFFYKNISFGFTLFWFEAYSSFSGTAAYNDWYMSLYNVFFTSFPVIALGVFDQDVSARACLKYPQLYQEGIENVLFSWPRIIGWMGNGVLSSIIIFFFTTNTTLYQAFRKDGQIVDFEILGATLYSSVIWTVNCQMALAINYFTWIQHAFIWGSIALWYLFLLLYGSLRTTISTSAYKVFVEACAPSLLYWMVTLFLVVTTLLPYLTYRAFQTRFSPMYHDKIQQGLLERENEARGPDELCLPMSGSFRNLRQRLRTGVSYNNTD